MRTGPERIKDNSSTTSGRPIMVVAAISLSMRRCFGGMPHIFTHTSGMDSALGSARARVPDISRNVVDGEE